MIFFLSNRNWHSVRRTFNQGTWKIRTGGLPPTQSWPVLLSELKSAYKKEQAIFSKRGSIVAMQKNKVIELIQSNVSQFLDYVPSFKSFYFCRSLSWRLLNLEMMKLPTRGCSPCPPTSYCLGNNPNKER